MFSDFRLAWRALRRQPAFAMVAVLSLGIALAVVTTTYAMLDAIVHPYVAYRAPEQLFVLRMGGAGRGQQLSRAALLAEVRPYLGDTEIGFYEWQRVPIQVGRDLEDRSAAAVSANFLDLLGIEPYLGRGFRESEPEYDPGALISYQLWRRAFNGRQSLAGMSVEIAGTSHPVVGVLPDGMDFPYVDVWTLLPASATVKANSGYFTPVVRISSPELRARIEESFPPLMERLTRRYGTDRTGPFNLRLNPIISEPDRLQTFHLAMGAAALVVLLVACSNLANLMLARGMSRRPELALRFALGAKRSRLVRLILAEAVILAAAGAALGILMSFWGAEAIRNAIPPRLGWLGVLEPRPNWRVFAAALAATAMSVVLFGLLPAIRVSQVALAEPLKDGAGSITRRQRRYSALVIAQVGLSLVLLLGAGLLMKSVKRVAGFDYGFKPKGLVSGYVNFRRFGGRGGDTLTDEEVVRRFNEIERLAEQLPGVRAATTISGEGTIGGVILSDRTDGGRDRITQPTYTAVSASFSRTLGLQIISGRDFIQGDEAVGAAVIDERAARELWPNAKALGRLIKLGHEHSDAPWVRVVGISRSVSLTFQTDPDMPPRLGVFVASSTPSRARQVIVRSDSSEAVTRTELRRLLERAVGPVSFIGVQPYRRWHDDMIGAYRFVAGMFGLFGALALALTAVGLSGVLSYAVGRRRREFGIRLALGAQSNDLVRLVVHDAAVMILAGTGLGAAVAMWGSQALGMWLYSVPPTDAAALVGAEFTLIVVAFSACIAPAIQATRADPLEVIRAI